MAACVAAHGVVDALVRVANYNRIIWIAISPRSDCALGVPGEEPQLMAHGRRILTAAALSLINEQGYCEYMDITYNIRTLRLVDMPVQSRS